MDSIGQILRAGRETRGLSLDEVHEATRITVQNLSALEDDRFDHFPNRVYARAFLRDYSNFLGMDSPSLLSRYEEEWNPQPEEVSVPKTRTSVWRVLGYTVLVLVIMAGLCAAGYFGWNYYEQRQRIAASPPIPTDHRESGATLPKPAPPVTTPTPKPPAVQEKPAPEGLVLEVTAIQTSWVVVKADGKRVLYTNMSPGQRETFRAKSSIYIFSANNQVRLKYNDEPQPPLGPPGKRGKRTFTPPKATPSPGPQ